MDSSSNINAGTYTRGRIIIFLTALAVAVLQGNIHTITILEQSSRVLAAGVFVLAILLTALFAVRHFAGKLTDQSGVLIMIAGGMLLRAFFVLTHDIWTLQNDTGAFTGFATDQINIGHIGYIEYIYKFGHLPDMDPYEVFGYFHPPVHHVIEALWLTLQRFLGVEEELLFENLQVPTLVYSGLCMLVMLHILGECRLSGKALFAGMAIFCFYPRMMVFAGSVNNDVCALLLLMTTVWRALVWCRQKNLRNILLLALALGFGMITKLNTAICAFSIGLIFLVELIRVVKGKKGDDIRKILLQYVLFGAVSVPIGMSFILRNLILFGKKPGLPTQGEGSVMYTGTFPLWSRIGIPSITDLHIDFPFHPISGEVSHNTWVILFQTGLFAESYPADIGKLTLNLARIAYVASILAAVLATVIFIKFFAQKMVAGGEEGTGLVAVFLWSTYVMMLLSYVLYVIKYPYTCSSDFRYMAASLIFTSLGFTVIKGRLGAVMNIILGVTLLCADLFWLTL